MSEKQILRLTAKILSVIKAIIVAKVNNTIWNKCFIYSTLTFFTLLISVVWLNAVSAATLK